MPLFRYVVTNSQGRQLSGVMNAASDSDVRNQLLGRGFRVDSVTSASGGAGQSVTPPRISRSTTTPAYVPDKVSSLSAPGSDMAIFFRSVASYLNAGMNIFQSLYEISKQSKNRNVRVIAARMAERVQAGGKLSDAMREFPRAFPDHVIGVISAGELGGFLAIVVDEIAADYELAQRASNRIAGLVSRFLWVSTIGTIILAPFIPLVVKELGEMFQRGESVSGLGNVLAMALRPYIIYMLSRVLPVLIILVGGYHLIIGILRMPKYQLVAHKLILKIPRVGKANLERSISGFVGILWRLHEAGVSIVFSWSAASLAAVNSYVAQRLQEQADLVQRGGTLSDALTATGLFSDDDQLLLRVAEKTGDTQGALERMAAYYKDSASTAAGQVKWVRLRAALFATIIALGIFFYGVVMYFSVMVDLLENAMLV